jgi:hypothetical protein
MASSTAIACRENLEQIIEVHDDLGTPVISEKTRTSKR